METATLQTTPKKGKSRFSKALPSPPAFFQKKSLPPSPLPARKPVPSPISSLPSRTSSATTPMAKPLESPLPPVPLNAKTPPPAAMTITRRPVAGGGGITTSSTLPLRSPAADNSPLFSLLSSYSDSNRSSDSTQLSTNGTTTPATTNTQQDSYPAIAVSPTFEFSGRISPKLDELLFAPLSVHPTDDLIKGRNGAGMPEQSGGSSLEVRAAKDLPPPPVNKESQLEPEQTSRACHYQPNETFQSTAEPKPAIVDSPHTQPQPQIWRRRSLKAEKNLAFAELKLVSSENSTASTSSTSGAPPGPPPKDLHLTPINTASSSAASTRSPLPLTPNAAFPGRNIRPVASRQQLGDDSSDTMGQEASRLKKTLKKAGGKGVEGTHGEPTQDGVTNKDAQASLPRFAVYPATDNAPVPVSRLPTPEYNGNDLLKSPIVETIVSPVSPAASPDLPSDGRQLPAAPHERPLPPPATSTTSLSQKPSPQGPGPRSPAGLPSNPASSRSASGAPQIPSQFPARTTSKLISQPAQKGRTLSETGSIETVKPHIRDFAFSNNDSKALVEEPREREYTDNPGALRFPRSWAKPFPEGTIFQPVPIGARHHNCISKHQIMHPSRNTYYPLACQACGLKDNSWRCTCSSCHLRICNSCRTSLRKVGGNLHALRQQNNSVLVEQSGELEEDAEKRALAASPASTVKATLA